jgi:hypothetical protein
MFDAIFPIDPTSFLLPFTKIFLSLISLVFRGIVAVGPIGQLVIVAIPTALFMKDIYAGPKAFKNIKQ